jgi:hypothetical protein
MLACSAHAIHGAPRVPGWRAIDWRTGGGGPDATIVPPVKHETRPALSVVFGRRDELYALSQGVWDLPPTPENEGKPAASDTRRLLRVQRDGFAPVVEGLDRPTSLEFSGDTAFVVTLTGKVLRIDRLRSHADSRMCAFSWPMFRHAGSAVASTTSAHASGRCSLPIQ